MNHLYRVTVTHFAPRGSNSAVAAYLVGTEDDVLAWLNVKTCGQLDDWRDEAENGDDAEASEFAPDDAWKARRPNWQSEAAAAGLTVDADDCIQGPNLDLYRFCQGDFEEPGDAFYGITHYHWENLGPISADDAATLVRLGIVESVG